MHSFTVNCDTFFKEEKVEVDVRVTMCIKSLPWLPAKVRSNCKLAFLVQSMSQQNIKISYMKICSHPLLIFIVVIIHFYFQFIFSFFLLIILECRLCVCCLKCQEFKTC